jgi:DNA ligase-1
VIDTIERFTVDAVDAACEGLVLKRLDGARSAYAPSVRAESWLKLKRDYCETLGGAPRDSLDLVPIGAWHGNGRKAGWYSPFLLAAYDPTTETYDSVCRCMSGFTDAFYEEKTETFGKRAVGGEAAGAAGEETKTKRQPSRKKSHESPRSPPG